MRALWLHFVLATGGDWAHNFECPHNFERHEDSCYAFGDGPATKTAGAVACEEYGAMLACPMDRKQAELLGRLAAARGKDYWIAPTDVLREGDWEMPCSSIELSR